MNMPKFDTFAHYCRIHGDCCVGKTQKDRPSISPNNPLVREICYGKRNNSFQLYSFQNGERTRIVKGTPTQIRNKISKMDRGFKGVDKKLLSSAIYDQKYSKK